MTKTKPPRYTCKKCSHTWTSRKHGAKYNKPSQCPRCHTHCWDSTKEAKTGRPRKQVLPPPSPPPVLSYEDASNTGGAEWHDCMWFDDTAEIPESCTERGYNVATVEIPLQVVDVTWRDIQGTNDTKTRPAAHPSERGCFVTMPLVLCRVHASMTNRRALEAGHEEYMRKLAL